jgi:putative DNA primase/helicase
MRQMPRRPALGIRRQLRQMPHLMRTQRAIHSARILWAHRKPIDGTIAEKYLRSRELPADGLEHCLGFEPAAYWREDADDPASPILRVPCLLAVMRSIDNDEILAVQKTRLSEAAARYGRHLGRRFIGRAKGAARKIDADEDVTQGLAIAEGLETALSGRVAGIRPCWALGSAGAIAAFPVLAGIDSLTVHREHHCQRNEEAFRAVADRWLGREVVSGWSEQGKDANDELRGVDQ